MTTSRKQEAPSRPDPDPTVLTTDALHREVAAIKEEFSQRTRELEKLFNDRFDSMEKYRIEQKKDTKEALDAALQAAKEAVGEQNKSNALANAKMETTFTKLIDAMGDQRQSDNKTNEDKFTDLKDRMAGIEARGAQNAGQASGQADSWKTVLAVGGLVIGLLAIAVTVVVAVTLHHG